MILYGVYMAWCVWQCTANNATPFLQIYIVREEVKNKTPTDNNPTDVLDSMTIVIDETENNGCNQNEPLEPVKCRFNCPPPPSNK